MLRSATHGLLLRRPKPRLGGGGLWNYKSPGLWADGRLLCRLLCEPTCQPTSAAGLPPFGALAPHCMCVSPPDSRVEILPHKGMVFRWAFGRCFGHEGRDFLMGLGRDTPESSLVEDAVVRWLPLNQEAGLPRRQTCQCRDLGLLRLQNWEKYVCCWSHPVCGVLVTTEGQFPPMVLTQVSGVW